MDASQLIKMKRDQRGPGQQARWSWRTRRNIKDAVEVLKKTEQDVIPQIENPEDAASWRTCAGKCAQAMGTGDARRWKKPAPTLNDRLLNYAYLL